MVTRVLYTYTPARLDELMAHLDDSEPRFAQKKRAEWRDQDEAAAVAVEQEECADTPYHAEFSSGIGILSEPQPDYPRPTLWERWRNYRNRF